LRLFPQSPCNSVWAVVFSETNTIATVAYVAKTEAVKALVKVIEAALIGDDFVVMK
jgi:hypothetical protein